MINEELTDTYLAAHGIRRAWIGDANTTNSDDDESDRTQRPPVLWWSVRRSAQHPVVVGVPFMGLLWLPWLTTERLYDAHTHSTAEPHRIARVSSDRRTMVIPSSYLTAYSLNGTVPLQYQTHFFMRPHDARADHDSWSDLRDDHHINVSTGRPIVNRAKLVSIMDSILLLKDNPTYSETLSRARMQRALVVAVHGLKRHIRGRDVLVMGSLTEPFLEVTMLAVGLARRVFTVDSHAFRCTDSRIVSMTPAEFWRCKKYRRCPSLPEGVKLPQSFDVIVAYSSVQHDGLGRYGDRIDPFGDVKLMWEMRSLLSHDPEAILLLGVPLGNDCLMFNRHRVYGRRRLPLLLLGYHVLETHGFSEEVSWLPGATMATAWPYDPSCSGDAQRIPLLVLQRSTVPHLATSSHPPGADNGTRWLPPTATSSWYRVPGLVGPYPLYHN